MSRLLLLLFLASTLLLGSPARASAPTPTLEAELVDAGRLRIRGRGFSQSKLEVRVEPFLGFPASSPCAPIALEETVTVRRGAFDVTLALAEGCSLACGEGRSSWRVRARIPDGEEVVGTDPLGCEPATPSAAEVRIRKLWRQWNPGRLLPPACDHQDPVRVLEADVDEAPGVETVLASRRLGVFLLGAGQPDRPLAWRELSCEQGDFVDEAAVPRLVELTTLRASGLSPVDLVLRTLRVNRCGALGSQALLDRRGRNLVTLLDVDVFKDWQCWDQPRVELRARVESPGPGRLRVTEEGSTQAVEEGDTLPPAVPFQAVRDYRLVGKAFVLTPDSPR